MGAWADTLVVDVCREVGADSMVKGLRGGTDFAYELPMAHMNRHLTGVETLFLAADPGLQHVSSSLIKEVVRYGGDVSGLVPDAVLAALQGPTRLIWAGERASGSLGRRSSSALEWAESSIVRRSHEPPRSPFTTGARHQEA